MFNKTAKKLFVSSLTLVFAAATAISSTYAWFTTQTTAKVSQIDINVTTGEGFEIRFGGKGLIGEGVETPVPYTDSDYKQTLTKDDLMKAYPGIFDNLSLTHVTMQATGYDEDEEEATEDGMFILTDSEYSPAEANKNYIEFEIYFRGRGDYNIYLTTTGTYGWSKGASMAVPSMFLGTVGYTSGVDSYNTDGTVKFTNRTGITGTFESGNAMFAFAADAARMSLKDKTGELKTVEDVISVEFPYAEPKVVKFTDGSVAEDVGTRNGYGDAYETKLDGSTYIHRNYAVEYYNMIKSAEIEVPELDSDEGYFLPKAVLPSALAYDAGDAASRSLTKLTNEFNPSNDGDSQYAYRNTQSDVYYGRIEVRIWLEGWDSDTFNAIFGDTLYINLAFEAKTVA